MFLSKENKSKNKDFSQRIKMAQKNAAEGKYAISIQRLWRKYKLRHNQIQKARKTSFSRFRDLQKVLKYDKIRAKFFLSIDKLIELLAGLTNSLSTECNAPSSIKSLEEINNSLQGLYVTLECCYQFKDNKSKLNNLTYIYFTGGGLIISQLKRFCSKLETFLKFVDS
jgi:Rps23 Pro-64 3,4-dihydroxylase Tpa1-like proline 4-hydroxylase